MESQAICEKKRNSYGLARQSLTKGTLANTHLVLGESSESQMSLIWHKSVHEKNCSYYRNRLSWLHGKSGDRCVTFESHFLMSVFLVTLKKELEYPEVSRKKLVNSFCRDVLKVKKWIQSHQVVGIVQLISQELFKIYSLNTTFTVSLELPLSEACFEENLHQTEAIRASVLYTCLRVLTKRRGIRLSLDSLISATDGYSEPMLDPAESRAGESVTFDGVLVVILIDTFRGYKNSHLFSPNESAENVFCNRATQTLDGETLNNKRSNKDYKQELENEIKFLKTKLQKTDELVDSIRKQRDYVLEKNASLEAKLSDLNDKLKRAENENRETLLDLGKLSFEKVAETNQIKQSEQFRRLFVAETSPSAIPRNKSTFTSSSGHIPNIPSQAIPSPEGQTQEHEENNSTPPSSLLSQSPTTFSAQSPGEIEELAESSASNDSSAHGDPVPRLSVQVEETGVDESISLAMQPSSSTSANVFNTYKLLLLTVSSRLLFNDVAKLKIWANQQFFISIDLNASDIIFHLDKKGVINAFDLSQLREFFETISRFDLLYLTDEYQAGDYDSLRNLISATKPKTRANLHARNYRSLSSWPLLSSARNTSQSQSVSRGTDYRNNANNTGESKKVSSTSQSDKNATSGACSNGSEELELKPSVSNINDMIRQTGLFDQRRSDFVSDGFAINGTREADKSIAGNIAAPNNSSLRHLSMTCGGSNGMKLSKFSRTTSQNNNVESPQSGCRNHDHVHSEHNDHHHGSNNDNDEEDEWLCAHYKRRCFVKFDCCDQFWPCHRCHNNSSTCGTKKLKSRDTTMVRCAKCGKEQKFGENGQYCVSCNIKFADFYCGLCKHLTGTDDHPYHCDKCGICRIHGDRSFHCDVCGVCLDVQLQGNHKCRPESAHDECCICLEDAFTGCQILPCSHKVHKNCATEMIRNGITRCPICRQSFRHKLQRRPATKK